ncbi:Tyrosine recombinase XerC [Legionella pneumophila]|uniref:tyrosine-type recombinase/integrase n=1 Tax=Legionella pneumophila TaxID=446 RepID=UPI000770A61B|nr:tyrosine-type recombinase/integrase [Legionella pneumophila]CZP45347.1 Tyrosine recombinase XerC [Legionella pneumophila]CZP68234.1 Tyrosine recombinase XerC [Legionella pneumophila]CZP80537.1 Tyrosine recombinase XerC [Legionella pneumophila]HAU0368112.1 tyrosine-type recombinase/integrase [Legionella pneumophila]HAU3596963.1 tyrosine-type recombinase/integrase [Legionella pneumophila]
MTKNITIENYISYQKSTDKSPATLTSYRSDLIQFAIWFESINGVEMKLLNITPTDARQYKQYLIDAGLRPPTINRRLLSLKYFLEWGWETKIIKFRFPLPKTVKQSQAIPKWLTRTQQNQLLRHVEQYGNTRDAAIVKILLNTGLRVSELCDLKWAHISMSERKGKLLVNAGKGCKYRDIPLNKEARLALFNLDYTIHAGSDAFVFKGQRGTLTPRGVQLMLNRLHIPGELGFISPHQLRHTFCKNLVDAGVSLEKVATLAGHERLDTTKLYCQPSFSDLSEAVEQIGEID